MLYIDEPMVTRICSTVLLVFFCASSFCFGGIENQLKKAEGKSGIHRIPKIDFIYMINLDERPEKYLAASKELEPYGITPYRFSAVNGWELSMEAINEVGLQYQPEMTSLFSTTYPVEAGGIPSHEFMCVEGRAYFAHCLRPGAIGCVLSHLSVLQDALDSGYETIWVMEDDIQVVSDPSVISMLIEKLDTLVGKNRWDVLYTDLDYRVGEGRYTPAIGAAKRPDMDCSFVERFHEKYTRVTNVGKDFRKITARFGTHSMIIRRNGIRKLLEYSKQHKIYLPYDIDNYMVPGILRYSVNYDIVTNRIGAESDITGPYYKDSKEN